MRLFNSSMSWAFLEHAAIDGCGFRRRRLATDRSEAYHCASQNEVSAMIIHDSQRGAGFLLTDSARLLRKLIDRRLQPLGLSRAQWSVLAILANHEGVSQSQISQELEIEKSTAGRLIDQVEKSGWIERRPGRGSSRAISAMAVRVRSSLLPVACIRRRTSRRASRSSGWAQMVSAVSTTLASASPRCSSLFSCNCRHCKSSGD